MSSPHSSGWQEPNPASTRKANREQSPCRALLAGVLREPVTAHYVVCALAADPAPDDDPIRDVHTRLVATCEQPVPAALTRRSGTILIPGLRHIDQAPPGLITAPLTATWVPATAPTVPACAELAHELLDLAVRVRPGPGIFGTRDLALEYQITRPGPGRDHLARLLTPLDPHPELLDTVREYLRLEHGRLATGRALGVHPNTVTNRLDKAGQLIGLDPTRLESLWQLRAAVLVRRFLGIG
ncbi:PucR family transcriptional regulator [Nocardia asteroides]|uniref:PucR family transcriptional regulator n=1 Tax=Nocardia asteroides TaxID=1824 RepID=UPI001E54964E|nr:helix-turn-helix domain-containing protein [Nocardia asteroides]UGT62046.1 helix-turn-helix domain-containing protein [Nocardia asteroides]